MTLITPATALRQLHHITSTPATPTATNFQQTGPHAAAIGWLAHAVTQWLTAHSGATPDRMILLVPALPLSRIVGMLTAHMATRTALSNLAGTLPALDNAVVGAISGRTSIFLPRRPLARPSSAPLSATAIFRATEDLVTTFWKVWDIGIGISRVPPTSHTRLDL